MPAYQARYTCSGELQQQIVDFISRNAQKYIIAQEHASREHIQCYVETEITKKTWDNKFREKFMNIDRRDKYFKPDKGRTKYYVCKFEGPLPEDDSYLQIIDKYVLGFRGFTKLEIREFNWEHWSSQKEEPQILLNIEENLISQPETKPEKVKKPRPPTFMRQCRDELEEDYPFMDWSMKHKKLVFLKVMNKLGEGCRNLDHIIITRMVYGVLNSLIKNKKEWHEYWYQKCFGELFLIDTDEDIEVDETIESYTAYLERIKKENEEEELRILNGIGKYCTK